MSATAFKSSTKVGMTLGGKSRSNEKLLKFIDKKLTYINNIQTKSPNATLVADAILVLAELYYALDRWLVLAGRKDSSVNTRRSKGVEGLFAQVVKLLSFQLETPINRLPNWLEEKFTVGMTDHGYEVDYQNSSALYYNEQSRNVCRLKITNGVVYQKQWWKPTNNDVWVKMNSEDTQKTGSAGTISAQHCGYVLSVLGDFYSGPHKSGTTHAKDGQYHSSYMGGRPVLCAGEIKIVDGKISHLNTSSGHYGPAKGYLLNVINALTLCGVDESSYNVSYHGSTSAYTAATMRKKIEETDKKVGGGDVNHLKSKKSWQYKNGVQAKIEKQIKELSKELDVITHFKTPGKHIEGFGSSYSKRAQCPICSSAQLHNKLQQTRYASRNVKEREARLLKLLKIADKIK